MTQNNTGIFIALGANLSNPKDSFSQALAMMEKQNIAVERKSGLWQSPAWPPGSDAPDYLNAVIGVKYEGSPQALLATLHEIEAALGRVRTVRNAPRTLDLDILDFSGQIIDSADLILPHPRMLSRGFVLFPLEEIEPKWIDPVHRQSLSDHIARLPMADVDAMHRVGPL